MRVLLPLVAACLLVGAAASAKQRPRVRIAFLPLEAINLSAGEGTHYQGLLIRAARSLPDVTLDERAVKAAPGCATEISCLRDLGALLGVEKLLALRVGRLGGTTVVRLTAFDVTRGARQGTWQEVLRRSEDAAVSSALDRMLVGLVPRAPASAPWYTRWWVWVGATAVVGGTITAAVLATRSSQPGPNIIITPP